MKHKALTSSSLPPPWSCLMPDLGDAPLQMNSCESAAGPAVSFPLYRASLVAAMLVFHWDVVADWGFFMTGGSDLDLQSESLHGKWDPIPEMSFPQPVCSANEVLHSLSSCFSFHLKASSQEHLKT